MLQEIFYWIFNMSLTAALTGMIIMLIRLIKRIPRRIAVLLWVIPFLRMTIPFGLNSPYSMMSLLSGITAKTIVVYRPIDRIAFSYTNSIMAANSYFPITYKSKILENIFGAASVIWVIAALSVLLMLAVTYLTTMHEIKDSAHLKDNIYLSEKVVSPAVYGIVKPKIILPTSYKDRDTDLIIFHEKKHIHGIDNLWRMIAFVITAVHWFNPFCRIFLKYFLTDLELSCDERVISHLGTERAKEYALTLLESRKGATVFASAFGGAKIRTRIENILSFKKMTRFSLTAFTVLIGAIFYVLLTNAG